MNIIINDSDLNYNEIDENSYKARALLIDSNNSVLIARYGDVILLPGGSIDDGESPRDTIKRELFEEVGQSYLDFELEFMCSLDFFQKDYPKREGVLKNRFVQTYYYVGTYKCFSYCVQTLTEKEKRDGFRLELVPLDELENIILENNNDNPRNSFFQREMLEVIRFYKGKEKILVKENRNNS